MSSTNEEVSAPPKRASPMDFRNTDLVSRLLAATPPYLYNMPLVPNSFFFSEMLRSLVQSKAEAAARMSSSVPHRRSRKRTWAQGRADHYKQEPPKDSQEMPPPNWTPPKIPEKSMMMMDRPLELTMNKLPLNNNSKMCHTETQPGDVKPCDLSPKSDASSHSGSMLADKEMHPSTSNGHIPMSFPTLPNLTPPDANAVSSDLMLPPPPPMWYPPLYPTPYAFDPLHFFIDLRVSGHIYDRKNQKEPSMMSQPPINGFPHLGMDPNASSTITSPTIPESVHPTFNSRETLVKSRHTSAFTVPVPSIARNDPLNLSGNRYGQQKSARYSDDFKKNETKGKFDIKSMGFDTTEDNTNSTNYIMKNLSKIYKEVNETKYAQEGIDLTKDLAEGNEDVEVKDEEDREETAEEKEKRCKDIRALIGLELVVDYVNHDVKPCRNKEEGCELELQEGSPVRVAAMSSVETKM